jgi:hypothetical protein
MDKEAVMMNEKLPPDAPNGKDHPYPSAICKFNMEAVSEDAANRVLDKMKGLIDSICEQNKAFSLENRETLRRLDEITILMKTNIEVGKRREDAIFGVDGTGGLNRRVISLEDAFKEIKDGLKGEGDKSTWMMGNAWKILITVLGFTLAMVLAFVWQHVTGKGTSP